ncbi:MAG: diguanylate cyclase [Aliarcobacter sp.]|nr:diguanylate cyclase [Aliarcobacter sp.]
MNILYVESNNKLIDLISENCSNSIHEIILLNNPKDALLLLEQTKNIDLIITEIDFPNLNTISYLKKIRKLNKNISLIVTSKLDIYSSFQDFQDLNISIILKKSFTITKLKNAINNINEKINMISNKYEIEILKENYSNLQILNEELNSFIKPFKDFSFYSETDLDGKIADISDSLCDLLGFKKEELIGQKHSILKHPSENPLKYVEIWQTISKGKIWIGELRCKDKFGHDIWYKSIIFPKKDINGIIVGYGAKRQDITDRKIAELQSITDDLTNLYNKRFFKQIFSSERNRAKRNKKNLVLLMLDIDNFKKYNDIYGHFEGDKALKKVASVLKSNSKRANDFAFRLGGEEFAIITSNLSTDKIMKYAQKIRESVFNQKIIYKDIDIGFLSVSIGVFNLEIKDSYSCDEIYKFADIALYKAKNLGRNNVVVFKQD